jgi:hypothetical protein
MQRTEINEWNETKAQIHLTNYFYRNCWERLGKFERKHESWEIKASQEYILIYRTDKTATGDRDEQRCTARCGGLGSVYIQVNE